MTRHNGTRAKRSRFSVYLVYALLPFVLFGILEGILRLTGVGTRMPLFVPAETPGYLQPNEMVIRRLFLRPDRAPAVSMDRSYFLEEKPADGIRIVVQGASSAAGYPFGAGASIARLLEQRLRQGYPERPVEVVSTAMPAINSFALLDFADEIAAVKPDAVVIYAGHNEYLGVLGVGSRLRPDLSPAMIRLMLDLRRLNLVEAGFQVYGAGGAPRRESQTNLMSMLGRNSRIPYGSDLFTAGHQQFRENLTLLLETYRARKIPVFIGTLAANESGLPPFLPSDLSTSVVSPWQEARRAFEAAAKANNAQEATLQAGLLVKLAPENALGWFLTGRAELLQHRSAEARHAFLRAKDLDELRFRAPESFNDIIRSAALEQRAVLVDVQQALALRSADRIIGDDMMMDHVHPRGPAYAFLADAFYGAILAAGAFGPPAEAPGAEVPLPAVPASDVARLYGEWRIQRELGQWPFAERDQPYSPPDADGPASRIARGWFDGRLTWRQAMAQALAEFLQQGQLEEAGRVAVGLAMAIPWDPGYARIAGAGLLASGHPNLALSFLLQATRLGPDVPESQVALAECYLALGRRGDGLAAVERALKIDAGNAAALNLRKRLREQPDRG